LKITQNHAKLSHEHSQKLTTYRVFRHPKMAFSFLDLGACKKRENQRGIFGALQTNVVKFVQKDIKSFKNHNFLCAQKILENQ
jgi:hypothetical protein